MSVVGNDNFMRNALAIFHARQTIQQTAELRQAALRRNQDADQGLHAKLPNSKPLGKCRNRNPTGYSLWFNLI
jgi:hypothetical protein